MFIHLPTNTPFPLLHSAKKHTHTHTPCTQVFTTQAGFHQTCYMYVAVPRVPFPVTFHLDPYTNRGGGGSPNSGGRREASLGKTPQARNSIYVLLLFLLLFFLHFFLLLPLLLLLLLLLLPPPKKKEVKPLLQTISQVSLITQKWSPPPSPPQPRPEFAHGQTKKRRGGEGEGKGRKGRGAIKRSPVRERGGGRGRTLLGTGLFRTWGRWDMMLGSRRAVRAASSSRSPLPTCPFSPAWSEGKRRGLTPIFWYLSFMPESLMWTVGWIPKGSHADHHQDELFLLFTLESPPGSVSTKKSLTLFF